MKNLNPIIVASVAIICHEANRQYCAIIGDNSQHEWYEAEQWQRDSAIAGVQFHIENPEAGDAASHEAWMSHQLPDGWKYGPFKNPQTKEHPCLVPFDQLPPAQQAKDRLFRAIVHALVA